MLQWFPAVAEQLPAGILGNPAPITVKAQAVPSSVAIGPDGALYVSLLRGVPSDPGTAYIYRVVPGHSRRPPGRPRPEAGILAPWPHVGHGRRLRPPGQAPGHRVQHRRPALPA